MNSKLIGFRAEYGINQNVIAKELGISTVTYGKKERLGKFSQNEISIIIKFTQQYDAELNYDKLFLKN